ncbi:cupin domain-containing protein [Paucibacter sediminis]|uniref:Cupin domain-containing protein n=1 Tax=Paucibacter sediminis TaxID=3019553 RepID=A0AA95SMT0_9BURK|nr:cupin domain-containing protein [Paucibacter sp. S2-9]WIT13628.1 cupin domain-containing protein [Paucibacter sp. S2-9]
MQQVIQQIQPEASPLAGIAHATWAGEAEGLSQLSVWRQSMAPGAGTPPHSHDCDEVVLCLAGSGELHSNGRVQRFGANCTLVLPKGELHQFFNVGEVALETLGIFAATPVATHLPEGEALDLPWRS